jgi:hypothetical protein
MRLKSIGGVRKVMWKFTGFSFGQHGIVAYRPDTAKNGPSFQSV